MSTRTLAALLCTTSILLGLGFRAQFVERNDFARADLVAYEASPYGIDLPDRYGDDPFLLAWTRGDGQAYVTLAGDPLAQGPVRGLGVALYRFARSGYSLASLLAVGGRVDLIPYGLLAVNLASLGVLGWIAGSRIRAWGWRSVILAAVPGALMATASDTAEALGTVLVTLAVVAPPALAVTAAAYLGIVRPDFATALFLRGRFGIALMGACFATAVGIRLVGLALGLEWAGLNGNLTWPLVGYLDVLAEQPPADRAITVGIAGAALLTLAQGLTSERGWRRLAFVTTGLFAMMLAPLVVGGPQNSLRAVAAMSVVWAVPPPEPTQRWAADNSVASTHDA